MHTSDILKTEESFSNKIIDKVYNLTIKALFAWENNGCWERTFMQRLELKTIKYFKWESSFYFYKVWPIRSNGTKRWIQIVRKYTHRPWLIVLFKESRMMFSRDLELNGVCKEVCVEETFTCITNCDSTDSECISTCLRDELMIEYDRSNLFEQWELLNFFKDVHVELIAMLGAEDVTIRFANAR